MMHYAYIHINMHAYKAGDVLGCYNAYVYIHMSIHTYIHTKRVMCCYATMHMFTYT